MADPQINRKDLMEYFAELDPDKRQRMLDAITTWKRSEQWTKDGGQFIPNPTTWLNGRRWEDELPTKRASSNPFLDLLAEEGGA